MNKLITISSALLAATAIKAQSPNVIFILADDLGYGDISAFNPESKIHTPNIDNLTHSGISFTDAHSSSALSTPSRYSIITGRYPWRTTMKSGVLNGFSPAMITPDRRTIAQMFSENGYSTACIGKWHLGWDWAYIQNSQRKQKDVDFSQPIKNGPTERGFDYFYGIPASLGTAPHVYIENNKVTALPNRTIGPQKGIKLIRNGVAGADFEPQDCLPNIIRHSVDYIDKQRNSQKPFFLYLPITAPHTPVLPAEKYKGQTIIGDYGDFVVMIDDMVQQIVETLKKNNQLENTIIIFTSDNGCAPYIGVKEMEEKGILCYGPYAADGFMGSGNYTHFDGILAMYHDQGLAPFKALAMEDGVNYTAGLPVVRTSPAHGTAYDIAGKGVACEDSFRQAIYVAIDVFRNRQREKVARANPLRKQYYEKRDDSDKLKLDTVDED